MEKTTKDTQEIKPEIGMGATKYYPSDRYPYTISWVSKSGKTFKMRPDDYKVKSGTYEKGDQEWEYTPCLSAEEITVSRRRDGAYRTRGGNTRVGVGRRRYYQAREV